MQVSKKELLSRYNIAAVALGQPELLFFPKDQDPSNLVGTIIAEATKAGYALPEWRSAKEIRAAARALVASARAEAKAMTASIQGNRVEKLEKQAAKIAEKLAKLQAKAAGTNGGK